MEGRSRTRAREAGDEARSTRHLCLSSGSLGTVEMQEKQANPKDFIENIVESLLEITSQYSRANDTSLAREPMEIYASAEEGASSHTRVHPYQTARCARRYYQARDANGRGGSTYEASPELVFAGEILFLL